MKIYTACRETGDFIEQCKDINEAINKICSYEYEDKMEGWYTNGFYDVVDENHCSLLDCDMPNEVWKEMNEHE